MNTEKLTENGNDLLKINNVDIIITQRQTGSGTFDRTGRREIDPLINSKCDAGKRLQRGCNVNEVLRGIDM